MIIMINHEGRPFSLRRYQNKGHQYKMSQVELSHSINVCLSEMLNGPSVKSNSLCALMPCFTLCIKSSFRPHASLVSCMFISRHCHPSPLTIGSGDLRKRRCIIFVGDLAFSVQSMKLRGLWGGGVLCVLSFPLDLCLISPPHPLC